METQISSSPKYSLNTTDLWKIGRGLLIVLGGTALTYFSSIILEINWIIPIGGQYLNVTPMLIPMFSLLIDTARKYLTNYQTKLQVLDIESEVG